jgi:hypothetical protein
MAVAVGTANDNSVWTARTTDNLTTLPTVMLAIDHGELLIALGAVVDELGVHPLLSSSRGKDLRIFFSTVHFLNNFRKV